MSEVEDSEGKNLGTSVVPTVAAIADTEFCSRSATAGTRSRITLLISGLAKIEPSRLLP
jgi:hypothetical protein